MANGEHDDEDEDEDEGSETESVAAATELSIDSEVALWHELLGSLSSATSESSETHMGSRGIAAESALGDEHLDEAVQGPSVQEYSDSDDSTWSEDEPDDNGAPPSFSGAFLAKLGPSTLLAPAI